MILTKNYTATHALKEQDMFGKLVFIGGSLPNYEYEKEF